MVEGELEVVYWGDEITVMIFRQQLWLQSSSCYLSKILAPSVMLAGRKYHRGDQYWLQFNWGWGCVVWATVWSGTAPPPPGSAWVWLWLLELQDREGRDLAGAGGGGGGAGGGRKRAEDDHQTSPGGRRESFWSPERQLFWSTSACSCWNLNRDKLRPRHPVGQMLTCEGRLVQTIRLAVYCSVRSAEAWNVWMIISHII